MRQRERDSRVDPQSNEQNEPNEPNGPNATNAMDRASALLRAGDEAIEDVLSGDSVQFLASSRQMGGQ